MDGRCLWRRKGHLGEWRELAGGLGRAGEQLLGESGIQGVSAASQGRIQVVY